jgi:anti-sigma B factor antagonist
MDDIETAVSHTGGWTVLGVSGELDALTGPALNDAVSEQLMTNNALVIDLSGVPFIDSSGLGVLVRALKRTREIDGRLKLVIDSDQVMKVMQLTALDLTFDIVPSLAAATAESAT